MIAMTLVTTLVLYFVCTFDFSGKQLRQLRRVNATIFLVTTFLTLAKATSAQTLDYHKLTLKFQTSTDHISEDITDPKASFKLNNGSNSVLVGVSSGYEVNRRVQIFGRFLTGKLYNPTIGFDDGINPPTSNGETWHNAYSGRQYDISGRIEFTLNSRFGIHAGYMYIKHSSDTRDSAMFSDGHIAPVRTLIATSFEGLESGVRFSDHYRRLYYGVNVEIYPRVMHGNDNKYLALGYPDSIIKYTRPGIGWQPTGTIGVDLTRQVAVEFNASLRHFASTTGSDQNIATSNHGVGVNAVYHIGRK